MVSFISTRAAGLVFLNLAYPRAATTSIWALSSSPVATPALAFSRCLCGELPLPHGSRARSHGWSVGGHGSGVGGCDAGVGPHTSRVGGPVSGVEIHNFLARATKVIAGLCRCSVGPRAASIG